MTVAYRNAAADVGVIHKRDVLSRPVCHRQVAANSGHARRVARDPRVCITVAVGHHDRTAHAQIDSRDPIGAGRVSPVPDGQVAPTVKSVANTLLAPSPPSIDRLPFRRIGIVLSNEIESSPASILIAMFWTPLGLAYGPPTPLIVSALDDRVKWVGSLPSPWTVSSVGRAVAGHGEGMGGRGERGGEVGRGVAAFQGLQSGVDAVRSHGEALATELMGPNG